jgi:hypothetical protein
MELKEAIKKAFEYAVEYFHADSGGLSLEEVDSNPDGGTWDITIGFEARASFLPLGRQYRVVRINKSTGELVSIKLRGGIGALS